MNIILKNCQTRPLLSRPTASNVEKESFYPMADFHRSAEYTVVIIAPSRKKNAKKLFGSIKVNTKINNLNYATNTITIEKLAEGEVGKKNV